MSETDTLLPGTRSQRGRPPTIDTAAPDARDATSPLARDAAGVDAAALEDFLSSAATATRRPVDALVDGDFEIPKGVYNRLPGFDFQWMTVKVFNEHTDPSEHVRWAEAGWKALPGHLAPEMLPNGIQSPTIDRMGSRLFVRRMELSVAAKRELAQRADDQKRARMAAALAGDAGPLPRIAPEVSQERLVPVPDTVREV